MWLATEATATAGAMPTKIKSGVIRKPPPMPNMPDTKPTAAPIARMQKNIDRYVGDRKVELHARLLSELAGGLAETARGMVS